MLRAPATTFLTHTVYIVGQACMHLIIRMKCFDDRRVCECGCLSDQFTEVARGVATFVAPHRYVISCGHVSPRGPHPGR